MSEANINQNDVPPDRVTRFVSMVLDRCATDKGYAASLRRADNPDTEYQSWEALAAFGVNLEKEYMRLPYATIAAAMARSKAQQNGSMSLGRAIARCYEEGNTSDQAKAKLRRLLACEDIAETCRILRPLLTLIQSRVSTPLDYVRLLNQLQRMYWRGQQVKAQWAQEFYSKATEEEAG